MKQFSVIYLEDNSSHIGHIHAAGCADLGKAKYANDTVDTSPATRAETAEACANSYFADEIGRGYTIGQEIVIFPCCRNAPEVTR